MPEAPTKQGAPENGAPNGEALPPPAPGTAQKPQGVSPTADTVTRETVPEAPLPPPAPGSAQKPATAAPLPPPTPGTGQGTMACPQCSAPLRPDQMVCTNCGTRNSLTWGRPTRGRAPLALAAVTLLALGATAGLIAWAVSDDEETTKAEAEQAQPAPQAQTPPPAAPTPAPTPTTPPETPPTTPPEGQTTPPEAAPSPTTPPEDTAPDGGGIAKWPAGKSAHTVILLSTDQRVGAERKAREVAEAGFPAGLLRSNRYPSLNPGYWVVFVGQYDSAAEASEKAEDLADQGYPGGYPRFVKSR